MESIRRKPIVSLVLFYLLIIIIKVILAYLVRSPIEFADGYVYAKMAREIFNSNFINVFSQTGYPPLYSLILTPAYAFSSMQTIYFVMKIINAIISSMVIFPAYLLAREFLNKKKSFFITALVALLASNFNISNYIMAENLFYPLFLFSVYFLYKNLFKEGYFYPILSGILIGLTVITKMLGIVLIPLSIILYLIYRKKLYLRFNSQVAHYFSITLILMPYFLNVALRSSSNSASSNSSSIYSIIFNGITGGTPLYLKVLGYLNWYVLYFAYLILASGILFSLFFFIGKYLKEEKFRILYLVSWILILFTIFGIVSAFSGFVAGIFDSRIIGRYVSNLLPLILVLGYVSFNQIKPETIAEKKDTAHWIFSFILTLSLFTLPVFTLLPMNNQDVAYFGVIKYVLETFLKLGSFYIFIAYAVVFSVLMSFYYFTAKKERLIQIASLILILNTILAASMTIYNANQWSKSEQYEVGIWLDNHDSGISKVLINEQEPGKINRELKYLYEYTPKSGYISYIGFWLNDGLFFSNKPIANNGIDYIITKDKLEKELLYETSGMQKIKIYKN